MIRTRPRGRSGGTSWFKSASYLLNNTLPTLIYDFESSRYYDSTSGQRTIPFSAVRTTNATMFDSLGRLVWAPANILTNSESSAGWSTTFSGTGLAPVITPNYGAAPDGSLTAIRFELDSGAAGNSAVNIPCSSVTAAHTASVWIKSQTSPVLVTLFVGNQTSNASVTTEWQRFLVNGLNVATTEMRLAKRDVWGTTGAADILVWHPQIERTGIDSPKAYNPTTGTAYYGPRIDYDPAALSIKGLLVEEARTNLITSSTDIAAGAGWASGATATRTAASGISPGGFNDATRVARTSTAGTSLITFTLTKAASALVYTFSTFVKADTATFYAMRMVGLFPARADVCFNLSTGAISTAAFTTGGFSGASATIQDVGSGWWRVTLSATSDATTNLVCACSPRTATGEVDAVDASATASLLVYGAQLEQNATGTSLIPTSGTSMTRAADTTNIALGSWFTSTSGTFFTEAVKSDIANGIYIEGYNSAGLALSGLTLTNPAIVLSGGARAIVRHGTVRGDGASVAVVGVGGNLKIAATYGDAAYNAAVNGAAITSGVPPTQIDWNDRLAIGYRASGTLYANTWIKEIRFYQTLPSSAQLQTLTA